MDTLPAPLAPMTRRAVLVAVERLDVCADAKVQLARLAEVTVSSQGRAYAIGRAILSFVFEAVKLFPNTSFGLVIGAVIALLIGSMAVLGGLLAPILGPLAIALGIGVGALADIRNDALRQHIATFEAQARAAMGA